MKLSALIIDDEPLAHDVILRYLEDVSFVQVVGQCYQASEAIQVVNTQKIDLIFLDIRMPRIQGLDLLRTLRQKPLVIITSAYQEYALESFELDVCDYLLKPFRFDRFLKAVQKAYELYQLKNQEGSNLPGVSEPAPEQQIFIKSDKRFIQLNLKDIYYLEAYGNYIKIWLEDRYHLTMRTMGSFEDQLPENDFIRVHKSFIVNKNHVAYLEGKMVILKNNKRIQVGKNYTQAFKGFIQ
ncbi:LytTR family DNA-binding domain-containing protein [Cytophagaceae bacterium DM2B3-1]|uniref:LytTR family DNA-binding domain-containing protein n=1 Tax=Xanthocytophaga flava TaxID=3048013 RepID=A0ABT7CTV1_9BACT|nr:LytTR family DNA-binding domain-containing protein [Xanthocytophaga flavus]MDJ1471823.1 LytTR family DNA-binding domain-containing protein [Xanthocytophaga flavus]MDJ1497153.1 LytTR family DNA-binding domain-containing protein [Xanthocytophaga flavus]